jgi:hypothetical protein
MPSSGSFGSGGVSFAAPGLTLTTANAAGVATTTIRSDASVLTYDATVPGTIVSAAAAAAGAAAVAARRDHTHGAPTMWTLVGSDTTERTTAAGSAADLVTITGLSIPVTTNLMVVVNARKTSGAAAAAALGLKINSTTVWEATVNIGLWQSSATDRAEDGQIVFFIGPRIAAYPFPLARFIATARISSTGAVADSNTAPMGTPAAAFPVATITDFIIRGNSGSASVTLGVQGVYVYAGA